MKFHSPEVLRDAMVIDLHRAGFNRRLQAAREAVRSEKEFEAQQAARWAEFKRWLQTTAPRRTEWSISGKLRLVVSD